MPVITSHKSRDAYMHDANIDKPNKSERDNGNNNDNDAKD